MSLQLFLAVLGAAFLHALWNALVKLGGSRTTAMLLLTLIQGAMGVAVAMTRAVPGSEAWPWLAASALCHAAYNLCLVQAYEHGDLSRVYPISRGTAPLLVLLAGTVLLSDRMSGAEQAGIVVLGLGIVLMARGALRSGESRRLIPFALGAAVGTAAYTLLDGVGARVSGDPVAYVAWLFVLSAVVTPGLILLRDGAAPFHAPARAWLRGGLAAAASYGAYAIAVWAMTLAPIQLVSALRETSILFAVLIGRLWGRERMDGSKWIAAGLIVAGVALTRLQSGSR